MKKSLFILLFTYIIFNLYSAQRACNVRFIPQKVPQRVEIIYNTSDTMKYVYEDYYETGHTYILARMDTLVLSADSMLRGERLWMKFPVQLMEYQFCNSKVNELRNSSVIGKIIKQAEDSARKYIGWENQEYKSFAKNFRVNDSILKNVCSTEFKKSASKVLDSICGKIFDIHQGKIKIANSIAQGMINTELIQQFLYQFNYCDVDKDTFLELSIQAPVELINQINQYKEPYQLVWRTEKIKKSPKLEKALQALQNSGVGGKNITQIIKNLKYKSV